MRSTSCKIRQCPELKHAKFLQARKHHDQQDVAAKKEYRSHFARQSSRTLPTSVETVCLANAMHHFVKVSNDFPFISLPLVNGELPLNTRFFSDALS